MISVALGATGLLAASTGALPTAVEASLSATHCTYRQLRVSEHSAGAAAGHEGDQIRFRNRSSDTCSLRAYPGAAGLDKRGKQIEQALRTKNGYLGGVKPGNPIPTVVLAPDQVATSLVEGEDVPVGHEKKCRVLHGLLVTPPNTRKSVHFEAAPPDCSRIEIHPVIRGKTGREA